MAKTVLLLGVRADLLEAVTRELQTPGIEFLGGTVYRMRGRRSARPASTM